MNLNNAASILKIPHATRIRGGHHNVEVEPGTSSQLLFQVHACGSGELIDIKMDPLNKPITMDIKKIIHLKWEIPDHSQSLVCCGHVLEDNMSLSSLANKVKASEKIWLSLRPGKMPQPERELSPILRDSSFGLALTSIFSLSSVLDDVSNLQDVAPCMSIFNCFCRHYSLQAEKNHFNEKADLSENTAAAQISNSKSDSSVFLSRTQFTWRPTIEDQKLLRCAVLSPGLRNNLTIHV